MKSIKAEFLHAWCALAALTFLFHPGPQQLHAAISDADLAKITQLLEKGRTDRARAEITILLDDNPNDPNAPKLRKILESLNTPATAKPARQKQDASGQPTVEQPPASGSAGTRQSNQTSGPSAAETLEWINANLPKLSRNSTQIGSLGRGNTEQKVYECTLRDGRLLLFLDTTFDFYPSDDRPSSFHYQATMYSLVARDVLGQAKLVQVEEVQQSQFGSYSWEPPQRTVLRFVAKPGSLAVMSSTYIAPRYRGQGGRIDDVEVQGVEDFRAEVKRRVSAGQGKQRTESVLEIPVTQEDAERFKKAFDHLISLHGGGKAEAF